MAKAKKTTRTRKATTRKPTTTRGKARTTTPTTTRTNSGSNRNTTPGTARFRTLTPYLAVSDANRAAEWYKEALGVKEVTRTTTPDGKVLHCELKIGDSSFMLSDIFPGSDLVDPKINGATVNLHVYAKNVDDLFNRAVENGCEVTMPLENQFWGDRYGKVRDPFGHVWSFGFPAKMTKAEKEQKQKQAMEMLASGQHG